MGLDAAWTLFQLVSLGNKLPPSRAAYDSCFLMLMSCVGQELEQGTMGMVHLCSTVSGPPLGRLSVGGWNHLEG